MARRPTCDQMETAALWLDQNEGDGDEGASCAAVAEWLRSQARDAEIRHYARHNGVPVAKVRKAIAANIAKSGA